MVPLGLLPVLVAVVKIMLIDMKVESLVVVTPIPDTRRVPEVAVDNLSFNHSTGRARRELSCGTGYHPHPNRTHCCPRCHRGTYVAQHCLPQGQTNCTDCPKGTFTAEDNYADTCRPCQHCRSIFGQIVKKNCSSDQDTVCGCEDYQYRTREDSEFFCKDCSSCYNGTVLQKCTKFKDTICQCPYGFFHQRDKIICSPCCDSGECKEPCKGSVIGSPSTDLNPLLCSLIVILGAAVILLLARRFIKKSCWKQQKLGSCLYPSVPQSGESVPKTTVEEKTNDSLLIPNQKEVLLSQKASSVSQPSQELPDCVKSAGESQIPDCPEVLYTIVDHVPVSRWSEFVRRLGLNENTIERIRMENRHIREGQYEMLRQWRMQAGHGATVEHISSVLNQMELSGCSEAIQEVLPKQTFLAFP